LTKISPIRKVTRSPVFECFSLEGWKSNIHLLHPPKDNNSPVHWDIGHYTRMYGMGTVRVEMEAQVGTVAAVMGRSSSNHCHTNCIGKFPLLDTTRTTNNCGKVWVMEELVRVETEV